MKKPNKSGKFIALALFLALLVGVLAGLVGTLFQVALAWIFEFRDWVIGGTLSNYLPWQVIAFLFGGLFAALGYFLTASYAPETGGSGVPEIEGALEGVRPVRWRRVLPVKFFASLGTLGAGLVLGREGPSIQIGASIGKMFSEVFKIQDSRTTNALLAAGAAGGLTAAFNAPIASIVFVIEEMRSEFKYRLLSVKMVILACICADIAYRALQGQGPVAKVPYYVHPDLSLLWVYAVFGIFIAFIGYFFNYSILRCTELFARLYQYRKWRFVLTGFLLGGLFGTLLSYYPDATQGGLVFTYQWLTTDYHLGTILILFILRYLATILCFSSGAPGGIFAPLLSVGTASGLFFGYIILHLFPTLPLDYGTLGVVGMGALFGSTVRAPLTGILLVLEITQDYELILPMLVTALIGNAVSWMFNTQPLYTMLLKRRLQHVNDPAWH